MSNGVYNGVLSGTANGLLEGTRPGTAIGVVSNYDKPGTITRDANLLVYYDAGNIVSYPRSGTTWTNLAGATLNATISNSPVFDLNNRNFTFNGTNNFATVSSTGFNRTNGQALSVAIWIKPARNGGTYQDLVTCRNTSLFNWILYQHTDGGEISLHGAAQNKSTYVAPLNTWTYITATVTTDGISTIYANGVPKYRVVGYTYNAQAPGAVYIGVANTGLQEAYKGGVGTVAIYNRALSAPEVMRNFIAEKNRFGLL
jgi:hypothetical protein